MLVIPLLFDCNPAIIPFLPIVKLPLFIIAEYSPGLLILIIPVSTSNNAS